MTQEGSVSFILTMTWEGPVSCHTYHDKGRICVLSYLPWHGKDLYHVILTMTWEGSVFCHIYHDIGGMCIKSYLPWHGEDLYRVILTMTYEGSLLCHIYHDMGRICIVSYLPWHRKNLYCNMGPQFTWSHQKERPIYSPLTTSQGYLGLTLTLILMGRDSHEQSM